MLHCFHTEWRISQVTVERTNYAANEKEVTRTTWCSRPVAVVFGNGKAADRHREQSLKYIVYLIILKCTTKPSNLYTTGNSDYPSNTISSSLRKGGGQISQAAKLKAVLWFTFISSITCSPKTVIPVKQKTATWRLHSSVFWNSLPPLASR